MKRFNVFHGWRCLFLALILFASTTACKQAISENGNSTDLVPGYRETGIAKSFSLLLEHKHVSKSKINETISQRAFLLYLKSIDPMKIYFNKEDVDQFKVLYENKLGNLTKKGDLSAAYIIYKKFIERVSERCKLAHEILDSPLNFDEDDYYIRDKEQLNYPATPEEARLRMTRKIKFEILSLEAEHRDSEKEAKEAKEKKTNETEQSEAQAEANSRDNESPIKKLHRRYNSLEKRIHQMTNDDVLEIYLTAVANAFDPHSSYMSPKTFENFVIQMRLNLDGIGATLGWEDGYTIVKSIVKGGAADKQGELAVEDKIIGVAQGKTAPFDDVVDMNLTDVVSKIRGQRGTVVRLEVLSGKGKGKKIITIVREKIELEDSAAQSKVFEVGKKPDGTPYKVGVIDLPSFYFDMEARSRGDSSGRSTTRDVRKILQSFNAEKVDACVLDLRRNGGGSLQEVVDLTGLFIETGTVVQVKPTEFGPQFAKPLEDRDASVDWAGPLVVVTSKFSASASEIFAGAIKDYKRGIIIGDETTHGKGTVQPLIELSELLFGGMPNAPNMGTLKVSIQGFYLPDGESTQLKGVLSDIVLPSLTNWFDGSEADSDYPLSFEKIKPAADWPVFNYVSPEVVSLLKSKSTARVDQSKEWAKVKKNISVYREIKETKKTPLSRAKYFAELDRLDMDKEEKGEYERLMGIDQKIHRDYYMNEVLDVTTDYLDLLHSKQIKFPESMGINSMKTVRL